MHKISALIKYFLVTLGLAFTPLVYAQQPFQTYDMIVSDPAGVVAALNKYQESPTGQQSTSTVILSQYVANGESLATHVVNNVYQSPGEALSNQPQLMEGFDVFLQRVSGIRTVEGRMITTVIAEWRP